MDPLRDPEEVEVKHLDHVGQLANRRVIEIGCGDGRMTWRYAALPRSIVGIDPDAARLAAAIDARPADLGSKVNFAQAEAEALPFRAESFEMAILAWSL
jgi:ubiquinone/menaquinone biosynthesis C-methylase UbiE